MRIERSKRAAIEAQHAEAAKLRAQHEQWVRYCEDVRTGKVKRRPMSGRTAAMFTVAALSLGGGVR